MTSCSCTKYILQNLGMSDMRWDLVLSGAGCDIKLVCGGDVKLVSGAGGDVKMVHGGHKQTSTIHHLQVDIKTSSSIIK